MFQILKRQMLSVKARAWEKQKGWLPPITTGKGGQATHTDARGEDRLKEVVQETIQVSRLPGLTCWENTLCYIYLSAHSQHSANLSVPYLGGRGRAVLGLDPEGVPEAGREPEHQGLEGCSQLCRKQWA